MLGSHSEPKLQPLNLHFIFHFIFYSFVYSERETKSSFFPQRYRGLVLFLLLRTKKTVVCNFHISLCNIFCQLASSSCQTGIRIACIWFLSNCDPKNAKLMNYPGLAPLLISNSQLVVQKSN